MKKSAQGAFTEEGDINLIKKIAQRDVVAFSVFYDRTAKTVFTFLSRLLKNRVESEDILQDTFWQVWRQSAAYDANHGNPTLWVLTMAKSLGLDRLKHIAIAHQYDPSVEETEIDPHIVATLSPVVPPASVRANLLNTMEQEKRITPRLPTSPPDKRKSLFARHPWLMAILWAIAVIPGAIWLIHINADQQAASRQDVEISSLRLALSENKEAQNALRLSLAEKEEARALMGARETVAVLLKGRSSSQNALGKVFWNPQKHAGLFTAFDLSMPQNGKVYQLWAIHKGVSVDAGVFSFSEETGPFKIKPILHPTEAVLSFYVTAEPAGGSSQPTGEILLEGES